MVWATTSSFSWTCSSSFNGMDSPDTTSIRIILMNAYYDDFEYPIPSTAMIPRSLSSTGLHLQLHSTSSAHFPPTTQQPQVVVKHKNFLAHDEDSKCAVGDQVLIESCQRVSKLKHFKVVDILKPAQRYTDEEGNEYSAIRGMTEREKERGYKDEVGWKLWQNRR